jgi:hypothetical protein
MKSFLSLLFVSTILLTSCKKEVEPQNSATTNIIPFTEVGRQMRSQASPSSPVQQNTTATNQNQTLATPAPVATGMNPAHGQPLHRCDIPVGAPLNSPAATAKNAPTQQINSPQNQTVSTDPANTATTPVAITPTPEGMNPPHGQTNHRCDIAVGAPLPKS